MCVEPFNFNEQNIIIVLSAKQKQILEHGAVYILIIR